MMKAGIKRQLKQEIRGVMDATGTGFPGFVYDLSYV